MRAVMLAVVAVVACLAPLASAMCAGATYRPAPGTLDLTQLCATARGCTAADNAGRMTVFSNATTMPGGLANFDRYLYCAAANPNEATGTNGPCCVDACAAAGSSATACVTGTNSPCAFLPANGQASQCVNKNKLCNLLLPAECSRFAFCNRSTTQTRPDGSQLCVWQDPTNPDAGDKGTIADKCPALHPIVVAMLILMFLTFIAAVVIVGVVVYRNQKAFDDDERRREQAEAAAAEAKRSRQNRNRL